MFTTRHTPPHSPEPAAATTLPRKDAPPPPRVLLSSHLPPVQRPRPERTDAAGHQQKRRRRRRREWEREGEVESPAAKKRRRKRRTRAEMLAARAPPPLPTPYMALPPCKHEVTKGCGVICRQELWADLQFLKFHYVPRQDLPALDLADARSANGNGAGSGGRYVIVDREPHADMVPRYILRERRESDDARPPPRGGEDDPEDGDGGGADGPRADGGAPLLRVSLLDVDRLVPARDLERFENRLFELRVPDSSTLAAWRARLIERREREERRRRRLAAARERALEEARERERRRVVPGPWAEGVRVVVAAGEVPSPPPPPPPEREEAAGSAGGPREAAAARGALAGAGGPPRDAAEDGGGGESGASAAEEYTISRILNHKDIMGTTHLLCAWEGLPESQATWLTEDELEGAEDVVAEYFDRFRRDAEQYASGGEESSDESAGEESNATGLFYPMANGTGEGGVEENGVLSEGLGKVARRPSTIDDWVLSISPGWEKSRDGAQTNGMLNGTDGSGSSRS
jgi:hypothetical protein